MKHTVGHGKVGEVGMSLEFANRICPKCKNPNYMVFLGDFSKEYKYKCMNTKVDMVEVVRCKDCKWYDERISMCDNCGLPREQTFFCSDGKHK